MGKKIEKKKMVGKIDHFFVFLILKLNSKIQKKNRKRLKAIFCYFLIFLPLLEMKISDP